MLKLIRHTMNESVTLGRFYWGDELASVRSLERPWLNNRTNVSCIPSGAYKLALRVSSRFGLCFEVLNVPDRSAIEIHPANQVTELLGCIAPGMANHAFPTGMGVVNSRDALKALARLLAEKSGSVYGPWDFIIEEDVK